MSCRKDTESGMGEYSLRKPKRKGIGIAAAVVLVLCLLAGTGVIISNHQNQKKPEEKKEKVYQSLSVTDRETADLYEELYETDGEQVAKILRIYRQNKRDILELVRYQKKELPLAAGAEEVIYSATQMLAAERRNKNRLGKLADMPVYSIPYPQIKKIAALKNHIWGL